MTPPDSVVRRELTRRVLMRLAGPDADAAALGAAMRRAYDDLAQVSIPLIGPVGLAALTSRAVHLAQREYPWLAQKREPAQTEESLAHVVSSLERQDPAAAAEAAAQVLATLGGLLVAFIGEGLTSRLLRTAWPSGFPDEHEQETQPQ